MQRFELVKTLYFKVAYLADSFFSDQSSTIPMYGVMDHFPHTALLFFFMLGTSTPAHAIKGNYPQIKITGLYTYYYFYSQNAAVFDVRSARTLPFAPSSCSGGASISQGLARLLLSFSLRYNAIQNGHVILRDQSTRRPSLRPRSEDNHRRFGRLHFLNLRVRHSRIRHLHVTLCG